MSKITYYHGIKCKYYLINPKSKISKYKVISIDKLYKGQILILTHRQLFYPNS